MAMRGGRRTRGGKKKEDKKPMTRGGRKTRGGRRRK